MKKAFPLMLAACLSLAMNGAQARDLKKHDGMTKTTHYKKHAAKKPRTVSSKMARTQVLDMDEMRK